MDNTTEFPFTAGMSFLNNTTSPITANPHAERSLEFVYWMEAIILPFVTAFGIITNVLSLLVLPRTHIVPVFKYCLVGLTLSDLGAAITGFIQMIIETVVYDGNPPFGFYSNLALVNYTMYYTSSMFLSTSAAIVIYIVIIRNVIIWKPLKSKQLLTKTRIKVTMVVIFLVTLALFIPTCLIIMWTVCFADYKTEMCVRINTSMPNLRQVAFPYVYFLTVVFGPCLLVLYVISLIGIRVTLRRSLDIGGFAQKEGNSNKKQIRVVHRITRTLTFILILDMLCTIPLCIQGLCLIIAPLETVFSETNYTFKVFDVIAETMLYLKPAYNFWLYVFSHREFREAVRSLCPCFNACGRLCACLFPTRRKDYELSSHTESANTLTSKY